MATIYCVSETISAQGRLDDINIIENYECCFLGRGQPLTCIKYRLNMRQGDRSPSSVG
jgi:hypothetical protein